MGNKVATFTEEQLEDYQDCTFFTRKEILRIFKRFRDMGDPGMVPCTMTSHQASTLRLPLSCLSRIPELKENPFRERISEVFTRRPDAGANVDGICFEEFLEMMSVFSEQAPRDLKVFYAFKIYGAPCHEKSVCTCLYRPGKHENTIHGEHLHEITIDFLAAEQPAVRMFIGLTTRKAFLPIDFDGDGVLGQADLERTCRQLIQGGLTTEEVATVCRKVLEESDIDGDGALSYLEFEHVVTRASDFMATFHIRI